MGSKPRARCTEKRFPPLERKGQRFLVERERERERERDRNEITKSERKERKREEGFLIVFLKAIGYTTGDFSGHLID